MEHLIVDGSGGATVDMWTAAYPAETNGGIGGRRHVYSFYDYNSIGPGAGNPCGLEGTNHGDHDSDGTGGLLIIRCQEFYSLGKITSHGAPGVNKGKYYRSRIWRR